MSSQADQTAVFELLRFTAAPVSAELAVVELDGRFAAGGRFPRRPVLQVDGPRPLEVTPLSATVDDGRWQGLFAVPLDALEPDVVFTLALRGTLLELPAPDRPADSDRFAALARETNRLRRELEEAEEGARTAREAIASAARATEEAVVLAREAAEAEAKGRIEAAQRAATEARDRLAAVEREAAARSQSERERRVELDELLRSRENDHRQELDRRDAQAAELRDQLAALRAEQRELRKQLRAARAEVEALRREAAARSPRAAAEPDVTQPLDVAPTRRAERSVVTSSEDVDASPAEEQPTTAIPISDIQGDTGVDEDTGAPGESVRVIGRPPRAIDPVPAIPPEHAAPPRPAGPQPSRWIAVAAFLLFLVILVYLVLLS